MASTRVVIAAGALLVAACGSEDPLFGSLDGGSGVDAVAMDMQGDPVADGAGDERGSDGATADWPALDWAPSGSVLVELVAGGHHLCALRGTGELFCWGRDQHLQLGDGMGHAEEVCSYASETFRCRKRPVKSAVGPVVQVAAGTAHTCALLPDASITCWGLDDFGQLGDAAATPIACDGERCRQAPGIDPKLRGMRQVSAGGHHSCGLHVDGTVWCWGANDRGQLGIGTVASGPHLATQVVELPEAVAVSAGYEHTCALLATGRVACWGATSGIGDGGSADRIAPRLVPEVFDVTTVAASFNRTCVRTSAGQVQCWGVPPLGVESDARNYAAPIDHGEPVVLLGVGLAVGCVAPATGPVACWGSSGIPFPSYKCPPTEPKCLSRPQPMMVSDARRLAVSSYVMCAQSVPGDSVACWGAGHWGEFGDGTTGERLSAEEVKW